MTHVISVRVPADWNGRVNSEQAQRWIAEWLEHPARFNGIPKPGPVRISIRLTGKQLAQLKRARGGTLSSTIRGIIGLRISEAPKNHFGGIGTIFQIGAVLLSLFAGAYSGVGQPGGQKPGKS